MLDKERHVYFSLHAIDAVNDKFGDMSKYVEAASGADRIKHLTWLLTLLLNEGAAYTAYLETGSEDGAEKLTERITALLLNAQNLTEIEGAIYKSFAKSNTGTDELPEPGIEDDEDSADDEESDENEGNTTPGGVN